MNPTSSGQIQQIQPGVFFIPELGRAVKISDIRQDDFFDTVVYAQNTLSAAANSLVKPFDNVSSKPKHHTNLTSNRRIPGRHKFAMLRLGVVVRQSPGNALAPFVDQMALYDNVSLSFTIGSTRLVTEGPLIKYQSGYGVTGSTQVSGASVLTLGVPSQAAAPKFFATQPINDEDDLTCELRSEAGSWLSTSYSTTVGASPTLTRDNLVSVFLFGIIERPISN